MLVHDHLELKYLKNELTSTFPLSICKIYQENYIKFNKINIRYARCQHKTNSCSKFSYHNPTFIKNMLCEKITFN